MDMKKIVTTGRKKPGDLLEKAARAAVELSGEFVVRGDFSLEELRMKYQTQAILVARKEGFVIDQISRMKDWFSIVAHKPGEGEE